MAIMHFWFLHFLCVEKCAVSHDWSERLSVSLAMWSFAKKMVYEDFADINCAVYQTHLTNWLFHSFPQLKSDCLKNALNVIVIFNQITTWNFLATYPFL